MIRFIAALLGSSFAFAAQATTHEIPIVGFSYSPAAITVKAGDRVSIEAWNLHPLKFDLNPSIACTANCIYAFPKAGDTYNFYCGNHGAPNTVGMAGVITVVADDTNDYVFGNDLEEALVPVASEE